MKAFILAAGIIWLGPKLTPQEAADILRPNQTRVVLDAPPERPRIVVVYKPAPPPPAPRVVFRPLTCCDKYVVRVPRTHRHR